MKLLLVLAFSLLMTGCAAFKPRLTDDKGRPCLDLTNTPDTKISVKGRSLHFSFKF